MNIHRLLPLIALLSIGCKSDDSSSDQAATPAERVALTADQQASVDQALANQKIGQLLTDKVSIFRDDHYQKAPLDRAPDLYLFYYTASW